MAENTNTMQLNIQVDDGLRRVPVLNTYGEEIGVFSFRPTDFGIIQRYNKLVGELDQIVEPLEHVSIAADGTADEDNDDATAEALTEAENRLFAACDEMFGGNMSEAFFGKMHPFSPLENGVFYCENALESVGGFISAQFQRSVKSVERRISRYTHGYESRTGKHRKAKR